jgi:hypothetical protein
MSDALLPVILSNEQTYHNGEPIQLTKEPSYHTEKPIHPDNNIKWINETGITIGELTPEYWDHSSYICTIDKKQFMKFVNDALNDYLIKHSAYVLFKLISPKGELQLDSSDCDDFVIYGIEYFRKLGVAIDYVTYPKTISINLVGKVLNKLDYNEEKDKNIIVNFYKDFNNIL